MENNSQHTPSHWSRPLKSAGLVLAGKSAQGVIALIYTALAARTLDTEAFGVLALIHGTVYGLSQLLRLHNWPAVVRYGAMALHANDNARLARLIGFTFKLDIAAALISMLALQLFLRSIAQWFGLAPDSYNMLRLYAISIVLMIPVPTHFGILRLFEQFRQIGIQSTLEPMMRLIGTCYLWWVGADLFAFLALWFTATIISRLTLFYRAWAELASHGIRFKDCINASWTSDEQGIWYFILSGSYTNGLQSAQSNISLMLVGGFLGPAAAGIFRIAQQYATILVKPTQKLLIPAIYPEFAKVMASTNIKGMHEMMWRCTAVAASIALLVLGLLATFGHQLILLSVGNNYLSAYLPMLWLAAAGAATVAGFALEPALSAGGHMRPLVIAQTTGLLVYVIAMMVLLPSYQLTGAGISALISAMIQAMILFYAAYSRIPRPL